jgi:hypothetical protein
MKKMLVLTSAAILGLSTLAAPDAEARSRRSNAGAVAAGVIGGLAAGALIAGATGAYAAPGYAYGTPAYGYGGPAYAYDAPAYDYEYAPPVAYRSTRVVRQYDYAPEYDSYAEPPPTGRVVRGARDGAPRSYGYGPAYGGYSW